MGDLIGGLFGSKKARQQEAIDRQNAKAEQAAMKMQQNDAAADAAEADQKTQLVNSSRGRRGLTAYLPGGDYSDTLG